MMIVTGKNYKLESSELLIPNVVVLSRNKPYNVSVWVTDIGYLYRGNEREYLGSRCGIEKTPAGFRMNVYKTTNRGE